MNQQRVLPTETLSGKYKRHRFDWQVQEWAVCFKLTWQQCGFKLLFLKRRLNVFSPRVFAAHRVPLCDFLCVWGWTHLSELLAGEVFQLRRVCDLVLSLVLALLPFVLQVGRNAAAEGEKGRKGWRRWDVTGEGGRWKGKTNKIKIK